MIKKEIYSKIKKLLLNLEKEEDVKILYACESGSRAWGFPSSDSDYDVRFIYIRKPQWYLSIDEGRDVIEREIVDEIDLNGWDLKKALKLYRKSNPPLLEWLGSPIKYMEQYSTAQRLRDFLPQFYSPVSCMYHYLHMAQGNIREYLKGEQVRLKKYFYVLRPLLACIWIEQSLGPVPTEFMVLVDKLISDKNLKSAILKLTKDKKEGKELSYGEKIPAISAFIEKEITRFKNYKSKIKHHPPDTELLNKIFRDALKEVWGLDV